jgi:D-alanyl-lipoteichoic acid acyltransferase DltB (MBOAT superfamily)
MLLGGLWHGASLNFVAWGGMHGVALAIHKFSRRYIFRHDKHYVSHGIRKLFAIVITFHFVCLTWIFFRNSTFAESRDMILKIFTDFHPELFMQMLHGYRYVFALMAFGYLTHFIPDRWQEWFIRLVSRTNFLVDAILIAIVIWIVIQVKSSEIQPFIYFQF